MICTLDERNCLVLTRVKWKKTDLAKKELITIVITNFGSVECVGERIQSGWADLQMLKGTLSKWVVMYSDNFNGMIFNSCPILSYPISCCLFLCILSYFFILTYPVLSCPFSRIFTPFRQTIRDLFYRILTVNYVLNCSCVSNVPLLTDSPFFILSDLIQSIPLVSFPI